MRVENIGETPRGGISCLFERIKSRVCSRTYGRQVRLRTDKHFYRNTQSNYYHTLSLIYSPFRILDARVKTAISLLSRFLMVIETKEILQKRKGVP